MPKRPLPDTDKLGQPVLASDDMDGAGQSVSVAHNGEDTDFSVDDNRKKESADQLDADYVARMELGRKIREAREAIGMSQSELARRVGMKQQSIGSIEAGDVNRPKRLPEIARALGKPLSYFLSTDHSEHVTNYNVSIAPVKLTVITLPVSGEIAAGAWMEQELWDAEKYPPVEFVPVKFRQEPHRAWHVSGSSMDKLGIVDGSFVVTVAYWDVRNRLTHGDVVVVERRRGSVTERTCKEIVIGPDGIQLVPRSSDTRHKPIAMPEGDTEADGTEIEVVGLVVACTRQF